ncbi:beta-galactosidase [Candidatus Uhrbacteria bacterium]|nr:beta-galactosidase [Candidatus Uhrbacteria bacterium]
MAFSWKHAAIALGVVVGLLVFAYGALFFVPAPAREPVWGAHFSKAHAEYLKLDWRATYLALLDEVGVRRLRLGAYWNELEPQPGTFRFDDLDWMLAEADARGAKVLLAVGRRLPRWPECHVPDWARARAESEQRAALHVYLTTVVTRYRTHPAVVMWQVENEPFLGVFGECPPGDGDFLATEIAAVRALDTTRSILVTDSGELSSWMRSAAAGDRLGHTLYRTVWNPWFGYISYDRVLPSALYRLKAWLAGKPAAQMMVAELQAEPWIARGDLFAMPIAEQRRSMDATQFAKNVTFAREVGFPEVYLWGTEYWYWLRTVGGDASLWESARALFRGSR